MEASCTTGTLDGMATTAERAAAELAIELAPHVRLPLNPTGLMAGLDSALDSAGAVCDVEPYELTEALLELADEHTAAALAAMRDLDSDPYENRSVIVYLRSTWLCWRCDALTDDELFARRVRLQEAQIEAEDAVFG